MSQKNEFLDHGFSDDTDGSDGYDSELAEVQKGNRDTRASRSVKRRKLSHSDSESEVEEEQPSVPNVENNPFQDDDEFSEDHDSEGQSKKLHRAPQPTSQITQHQDDTAFKVKSAATAVQEAKRQRKKEKEKKPGVIYLSSLPPYLKPSALRNLLQQRGFEPITRLFLTPASKAKSGSKKNSRQLYTEGWIEFASKKTARECAESLNANIIGGRKGGFYYDDLWNMKYLKGMAWSELMAGIREEKREEEGRRDEERRTIAKETKRFIEGVEQGKRVAGMQRKRKAKERHQEAEDDLPEVKRTWRQFDVKGSNTSKPKGKDKINEDVQAVLGKIF